MTTIKKFRTTMKRVNGDLLTPISIFNRIQGKQKFLLESSSKYENSGRYSFIGFNPRKTYRGAGSVLQEISHLAQKSYSYDGELLRALKQVMPRISNQTEFPFTGGAIGYISGALQQDTKVEFQIYDTLIIFDHMTDELIVFHTNIEAEQVEPNIDDILKQLFTANLPIQSDYSLTEFIPSNQTTQGDAFTQTYEAHFSGDAFALYRKMRIENPSSHMFYIELEDKILIGSSPESLINVTHDTVTTKVLTASAPRTQADLLGKVQLLENNEQLTAQRLHLERICISDTITTDASKTILTANSIELMTQISGELSPTLHAIDALAHVLPASGAVGYIGFNGQIDFAHATRTLTISGQTATLQTGHSLQQQSEEKDTVTGSQLQLEAFRLLVNG